MRTVFASDLILTLSRGKGKDLCIPAKEASGRGFVSGYAFRRTVNISDRGPAPIGCDRHATYDPDAVGDCAARPD
jgi:hypothetical protein